MNRSAGISDRRSRTTTPRHAVVLKTYQWDDFVHRQADRCKASTGEGDFYVLIDESSGATPAIPFQRVVRTSNRALVTQGLADRFERGSLIWWNADYPHYHFHALHPDYDFYVFLEYDALFCGNFEALIRTCAELSADLVVHELEVPKESWHWTRSHTQVYPLRELEGCLMSISVLSQRALAVMAQRRMEMKDDAGVTFWPSAEVFMPTEARRAGLTCLPLAAFGETSGFRWRPPLLEEDLPSQGSDAFFHPVYDRQRFVSWALAQGTTLRSYVAPRGPVLPHLKRLPLRAYLFPLLLTLARGIVASLRTRGRWLRSGRGTVSRRAV